MANSMNTFKQVNTSQLLAGWRSFQETSSQLKETKFQSHLACCLSTPTAFDSYVGDSHSRNLEPSELGNKGATATALSGKTDLDCGRGGGNGCALPLNIYLSTLGITGDCQPG